MTHILLFGFDNRHCDSLWALWNEGYTITRYQPNVPMSQHHFLLAFIRDAETLANLPQTDLPLLIWLSTDDSALTLAAYTAGASAVLPAATPSTVLLQRIRQMTGGRSGQTVRPQGLDRRYIYTPGERIHLDVDLEVVLTVEQGIVAQKVIHEDGAEILLGFFGPGQLLIPHPEDSCFIQLVAHTEVSVCQQAWQSARQQPDFAERLRARLRLMEAWSAMQARPHLADRLLGLLSLLAEQFGLAHGQGTLIDLRITHQQLASAVGAARTTVTRLLGELRRRRLIVIVGRGERERFCLRAWEGAHHVITTPQTDLLHSTDPLHSGDRLRHRNH
jgi:CRP-like cAMP-binding protein